MLRTAVPKAPEWRASSSGTQTSLDAAAQGKWLDADDEGLKQQAADIVEQNFPECRGKVLFVHVIRWNIGIAQFPPGRLREMTALRKRLGASNSPYDLCGDYLDGLSSEGALKTGEEAAGRTARKLKSH